MSDAYRSYQALAVQVDDFISKLHNAYGPDMEEVERLLRRDARSYYEPCYGSRMKVKLANLLRTNRKERARKS